MNFSILIYASPHNSLALQTAYRFTRAALTQGHQVERVFFYGESVQLASLLTVTARDEIDIRQQWIALAEHYNLDLVVCIAAAVRRGILDAGEAKRHDKPAANLAAPFVLSGLGQLADAMLSTDRLITFGSS